MKKPITFKTALWIVLALHVLVYVGIVQISSLRYKLAKTKWNEKMQYLASKGPEMSKNFWPDADGKQKVITKPPAQKLPASSVVATKPPSPSKPSITIGSPSVKEPIKFKPIVIHATPVKQKPPTYPIHDVANNRVIYKRQVDLTEKIGSIVEEFTEIVSSNIIIQ